MFPTAANPPTSSEAESARDARNHAISTGGVPTASTSPPRDGCVNTWPPGLEHAARAQSPPAVTSSVTTSGGRPSSCEGSP
jgi:hypothetical protein